MSLVSIACLLLVACGGAAGDVGAPDDDPTTVARAPIGDWVLTTADPAVAIPDGSRATLTVTVDGTAGGDTPCNGYGGRASWGEDGTWRLDEVAVTEMGCEPDRMDAQDTYLDALLAATTWSLDGTDTLELTGGDARLVFTRLAPVDAAALVGTDWRLDGFIDGDAVSSRSWDVEDARLRFGGTADGGDFTLSSGCRDFAGEWVAAGDAIRLPTWGQADGSRDVEACTEAELESEALVLAVFEDAFRATVDGATLELRATADADLGLLFRVDDEDPTREPASSGDTSPGSTDEEARERCEAAIAMPEDGVGYATREEALTAFINGESGWWTPPGPGFGLDGTTITLDGQPVGEVSLFQFTNGTWAVSGYEVCYPADLADG